MTLTVGSLFSGIGGIDLGLERAGMRVVWQSEIDPYACRVLAKHWPDVPNLGDITTIDWSTVEPVDVIAGGFPCQDISQSGLKAGIAGARSGLWAQFARCIRDLRPRFALVENVGDLAVRGLDRVLGDLAALGYDAEWQSIEAAAVGAPHRRDRLFIVAYPNGSAGRPETRPANTRARSETLAVRPAQSRGRRRAVAHTHDERSQGRRLPAEQRPTVPHVDGGRPCVFGPGARPSREWPVEPDVGRVAHGVPSRVDRLRCLGNAVVPQVAEWIGRRLTVSVSVDVAEPDRRVL